MLKRRAYQELLKWKNKSDKKASRIFSQQLDASTIHTNLTAYLQTPLEPGKTLILFDEIQECPEVRAGIKFLVEDGRFDYIESGSLLCVKYKNISSFPVGYEQILPMYVLFTSVILSNISTQQISSIRSC